MVTKLITKNFLFLLLISMLYSCSNAPTKISRAEQRVFDSNPSESFNNGHVKGAIIKSHRFDKEYMEHTGIKADSEVLVLKNKREELMVRKMRHHYEKARSFKAMMIKAKDSKKYKYFRKMWNLEMKMAYRYFLKYRAI